MSKSIEFVVSSYIRDTDEELSNELTIGEKIHSVCKLIEKIYSYKQNELALYTQNRAKSDKSKEKLKVTTNQLSALKHPKGKAAIKRAESLFDKLILICSDLNITDVQLKREKSRDVLVGAKYQLEKGYTRTKNLKIDSRSIINNGLTKIIPTEPSDHFEKNIIEAFEVRILQSCLYGWEGDWERILKLGLEQGKLTKIKFLLAQPYSVTSEIRAHTLNLNSFEPVYGFNLRIRSIIEQIVNFCRGYDGEQNPTTGTEYQFEISLYYHPSPISVYQILDINDKNIHAYFGIFWNHTSSRSGPHFVIEGDDGDIIPFINNHFKSIWNNKSSNQVDRKIDWQILAVNHYNINVDLNKISNEVFDLLKRSKRLSAFSPSFKGKPNWIRFRCYYHNKDNKKREFYLDIDTRQNKARIKDTERDNTYYGVAIQLGKCFSIIVHTARNKSPDRIIYINFFARTGKIQEQESPMFGVYNNSDYLTGFPYAQVIVIQKINQYNRSNTDMLAFENPLAIPKEFSQYSPSLKEKKIDIEYEENTLTNNYLNKGNYVFTYDSENKEIFFDRLQIEIERANQEIFFLGHGPDYFPEFEQSIEDSYFESHLELVKSRDISIQRVLMTNEVSKAFLDTLKKIMSDGDMKSRYSLYAIDEVFPVISDLVLIDPDSEGKTAIITYKKIRYVGERRITYPVKMEIIKDDLEIIQSFKEKCISYRYLAKSKYLTQLKSEKEVENFFKIV